MSDPSVDLEKGITRLTEEEKGITGLKEEEKKKVVHHQFKHLKTICVMRLLDVLPVLYLAGVVFMALCFYKRYHAWWPTIFLASFAIICFWIFRWIKHKYIQQTLATADSDLSTTLLASSKKEANRPVS